MQKQGGQFDVEYFRVVGLFALIIAGCLISLYLADLRAHFHYGAKHLSFQGWMAGYTLVAGWGLMRLRKWAAVMLALPPSFDWFLSNVNDPKRLQTLFQHIGNRTGRVLVFTSLSRGSCVEQAPVIGQ